MQYWSRRVTKVLNDWRRRGEDLEYVRVMRRPTFEFETDLHVQPLNLGLTKMVIQGHCCRDGQYSVQ